MNEEILLRLTWRNKLGLTSKEETKCTKIIPNTTQECIGHNSVRSYLFFLRNKTMLILWLSLENTALITRASKRCTPAGCTPSAHSSSCPNVCMAPFSSSSASQFPPEWGWLHLKMMWKRNIPSAVGCLPHSERICLPSPWAATKVALKASHSEPDKMAKFFLQPWKMERTELSGARTNVPFFFC